METYWSQRMSPEDKEKLKKIKTLKVREGLPNDLTLAIETFMEQACIVAEYDLEHMPPEYMEKLLKVMSKYPEHNLMTLSLLEILNKNDLM